MTVVQQKTEFQNEEYETNSTQSTKVVKFGLFSINPEEKIHRTLPLRIIQLISISGAIGTAVFISIGSGLMNGGPLSLLLAFGFWSFIILLLNNSVGEMVSYLPIASPFVTLAGRCVDGALEFAAGWNFYLMISLYIPFEITAVNGMIHYWRSDYSAGITLGVQIVLYALINIFAVRVYGETEFWLSISKLILIFGLMFFTLITMSGGNPQHHAYGFENWGAEGGPMAEYMNKGASGRFQGLISAMITAAFTCTGPEYLAMTASEAENPRVNMPKAFKSVIYRLVFFYVIGALCVGIVVAYNNENLINAPATGAAKSPYVVAMNNLNVKVLPDIVNAVMVTSAFSAGNSFVYSSTRTLYSMATQGFAPKIFSYCTKSGVPIFCFFAAMCFALLSLLQLGNNSATVLGYFTSVCTGSQVLNYVFMCITYFGFYRACNAQGIDRNTFKFKSWGQPYSTIFCITFLIIMVGIIGYTNFLPGNWDTSSFIINYIMVFINIFLVFFWKIFKKTKYVKPEDADLATGLEEIEEHEYEYYAKQGIKAEEAKVTIKSKILQWMF
ncbi:general amino acid permease Agp2p [[Candida] jaroonii]|uniref:General amino acid permease Agp2p n=1 Tax=[Candida] jaroonii TaxID=467808 RepID=A0ACA9YGJ4_9ASCO|nr:general amino acid permease Agp2p [[Candida] jaroonii]